jgi:hypothetical protein
MVNKRTNHLVVVLDELDSTIKDVAFECIVLNRYGNFEKATPYSYLHADVTNLLGFIIITMTIGGVLTNFHFDKFVKGKHLRIDKFLMQTHAKFEKGDLNVSLKVMTIIDDVTFNETLRSPFSNFVIAQLWSITTFDVVNKFTKSGS